MVAKDDLLVRRMVNGNSNGAIRPIRDTIESTLAATGMGSVDPVVKFGEKKSIKKIYYKIKASTHI